MKELCGKIIKVLPTDAHAENCTIIRSLGSLREMAGLTIEQMANRLDAKPGALLALELENDMNLEHLRTYAHALGGEVQVVEREMQESDVGRVYCIRSAVADDTSPGRQLVLPMFNEQFTPGSRDIVLSIHPKYCSKILAGEKTVELRRRFPVSGIPGSIAYIYSTSPVQAMIGRMEIADVVKLPILEIWQVYGSDACIEKGDFDSYFAGLAVGTVLEDTKCGAFIEKFRATRIEATI